MPVVVMLWSRPARLARARRCVFEGAQRVAAQQERLKRLRAGGYDASVAASLLDTFEDSQLAFIARLASQEADRRR
jgi:hypothetical protein